jgi:alpha-D-xyloside xylohydrolase
MKQINCKRSKTLLTVIALLFFGFTTNAQKVEKTAWGIKTTVQSVSLEIQFYSPEMVRIIKTPDGTVSQKESLSVIKQPEKVPFAVASKNNLIHLKSEKLEVVVDATDGHIAFNPINETAFLTEKANTTKFSRAGNGFKVGQAFLLDKEEAIYGLGQHQTGKMNQRNQKLMLQQVNMNICIPFFQSIKGYGLFWDNYSSTVFTDDEQETSFASEVGDEVDYYVMYGSTMDGVIACMRDLTGQAPLYPLWAHGYLQSKERYVSQEELVGVVRQYRELHVPIDGIIQDWQYWGDNAHWNAIEFLNPAYPDPKQMIDDIHRMNAHAIISVWPAMGRETNVYQTMKEKDLLLPLLGSYPIADSVVLYNVYSAEARDVYWEYMNKNMFSLGMDGWWLDATEPEYDRITNTKIQLDQPTELGSFRQLRNAFPLMTVKGVYEHQRQTSEDKRVFILTRSAFAGQQRYSASVWSGDVNGEWDVFGRQIPAGLNYSLTGMPYWNTDIGGFLVINKSTTYADYRELYVRWLQFCTFTPMMRAHGANTPREIWQFGKKGDWAYDAIESFIRLRYRLLPYHYALSWGVTANAGSLMRMLSMDFPQDKKVHDMGHQYLYGKSFLVVPVTDSFYTSGEKENSIYDDNKIQKYPVYLPEGADWYDFWTGEKFTGGQSLEKETPIDIMPLYVKAGSIIPLGPEVQYATEKSWDNLEIRIYEGADAEFTLYEDENDNYNYEKGMYSTITMKWDDKEHRLIIEDRKGSFPGMLPSRQFRIVKVAAAVGLGGIGIEPFENQGKMLTYDGKKAIVDYYW